MVRNRYSGRTFIQPSQAMRQRGVTVKLSPLREVVAGKRLVVVDDSIVRGTTTRQIVALLRKAGATEVHLRISSPPIHHPCFYGIDTQIETELIASTHSVEEIREFVGADSLSYLSIGGVLCGARPAVRPVLLRLLRRALPGAGARTTRPATSSSSRTRPASRCRRARPRRSPGRRLMSDAGGAGGPGAVARGAKRGGAWGAYRGAGVDIDAGERAVELMRASVEATRRPEVIGGLGGFASAMALPPGMREPVLVSSTDGVGTKTAIAMALGRYDTIGLDLVAMCADDLVCAGAEPLFFLDYVAVGRVFPERVAAIVGSVADGCRLAGCSLIGGETAEHPGLMEPDEFDLAGFCVGVVERDRLLDGTAARAGDALVGIAASGLHSNGFSLVRRIVADAGVALDEGYAELVVPDPGPGDGAGAGDGCR